MNDIIGLSPKVNPQIIAGAMSGTSADGVDVAIVRLAGPLEALDARLLHHHYRPYPPTLRQQVLAIRQAGSAGLRELMDLSQLIGLTYAAAVNEARLAVLDWAVDAVAAHGQTLFHDPPLTMQCMNPAVLAAETGLPVLSDFRSADCAAGGQGAPLVPLADYALFRRPDRRRALLNIGGIANLTLLPPATTLDQLIAFDTGPGNCLSDHICRRHARDDPGHDSGGAGALRGRAIEPLVEQVLAHDYFARRPPKSTDTPAMIAIFEQAVQHHAADAAADDLLASAAQITARAVERALADIGFETDVLIVSGGGIHNAAIMGALRRRHSRILISDEVGIPAAAREAIAFAILGYATLRGLPGNVPSATGAARGVILGSITPSGTKG